MTPLRAISNNSEIYWAKLDCFPFWRFILFLYSNCQKKRKKYIFQWVISVYMDLHFYRKYALKDVHNVFLVTIAHMRKLLSTWQHTTQSPSPRQSLRIKDWLFLLQGGNSFTHSVALSFIVILLHRHHLYSLLKPTLCLWTRKLLIFIKRGFSVCRCINNE